MAPEEQNCFRSARIRDTANAKKSNHVDRKNGKRRITAYLGPLTITLLRPLRFPAEFFAGITNQAEADRNKNRLWIVCTGSQTRQTEDSFVGKADQGVKPKRRAEAHFRSKQKWQTVLASPERLLADRHLTRKSDLPSAKPRCGRRLVESQLLKTMARDLCAAITPSRHHHCGRGSTIFPPEPVLSGFG